MTAQTTNKSAAPKSAATPVTKDETVAVDNKTVDNKVATAEQVKEEAKETPKVEKAIPEFVTLNPILAGFYTQYVETIAGIAEYNKSVLAEKDSEWTASKLLEKARDLARPTSANVQPDTDVLNALKAYEDLVDALAKARKSVLEVTGKSLGIVPADVADRNPETEAKLKEQRKYAVEIGNQLLSISKFVPENIRIQVTEFLENTPLPAIGRDQTRTFTADGKTTPKYRVTVQVFDKDGVEKFVADGFTKAALALTKLYDRGQAPKSDTLRAVWEKAGNTADNTVQPVVEFDDNDLHFVITKK